MVESLWDTDNYRWSPWTAGEGIDAYIRRRRDEGWIYQGKVPQGGATILLRFKRLRHPDRSQVAAARPTGAA